MVKLISIAIILAVFEVFITDTSHAQMQNSSVMSVRAEVVQGVIVKRMDESDQISLLSDTVPYGVFSIHAAKDTEMLISAQNDIEMNCEEETWTMNSEIAVNKQNNGAITLSLFANVIEKRSNGLHRGIQSLTIEYL